MSPARVLAVLLFSTLLACSGSSPGPTVDQGPSLPATELGESTVGAPFSFRLIVGSLPAGLQLSGNAITGTPDMIDHTLASDEVMGDSVSSSAFVLRPTWIPGYSGTTSDHYPVLSRYAFGGPP